MTTEYSLSVFVVALRKESVDRNSAYQGRLPEPFPSLSARRAWIEILTLQQTAGQGMSLSARRAWIEITVIMITQGAI